MLFSASAKNRKHDFYNTENIVCYNTDEYKKDRHTGHTDSFVSLTVSKPGKATISVTYTLDGKERTANYKAEFQRYSDIFRKVSVGGKTRKYNSNDYGYYVKNIPGKKTKVSVKLNSGWKVKKIIVKYPNKKGTLKKVKRTFKNGSYVPVKKCIQRSSYGNA